MQYALLGPLEVRAGDRVIPLGGVKQRALLAALLLHANEVVSRDRLIDGLWGERPPVTAAHTVETYVSRLRKALNDAPRPQALITRPPGYMLRIDPAMLDLNRFETLAREGRRALAEGNAAGATELLQQALGLFRGPPLDDVASFPLAQAGVQRLTEMRLAALEDRIEADLAIGRPGELVGELQALVKAYPMRERFHGQLMLTLYRVGRQAEGLEAFRRTRQYLTEEFGVEPSAALRRLEQAILLQDPSLEPARWPLVRARRRPSFAWRHAVPLAVLLVVASLVVSTATTMHRRAPLAESVRGAALGIIDPGTGAMVGEVPLRSPPGRIAVGVGSVWVTDFDNQTVSRIEGRRVRQVIPVGGEPSGIALGSGAVWVANALGGTVVRIDPGTGQVVQTIPVGDEPSGMAYGEGKVWVASTVDHTVTGIDPTTGEITKRVRLDASPTDLAVGNGAIWATSQSADEVFRIDPDGNDVAAIRVGTGPSAIAAQASAVWVANTLDGTVSRIDPSRDVVTATVQVGDGPSGVAISDDAVWVTNEFAGTIARIDPHTPAVSRTFLAGNRLQAIAVAGGSVWVGVEASPGVARRGSAAAASHTPYAAVGRLRE
jgi:YVTN family beta-propeller protein